MSDWRAQPICEIFFDSVAPLMLKRKMKLFKGRIGIEPGIAAIPKADFIVSLITEYPTHKALMRAVAGDQYKNLENFQRKRHAISDTSRNLIAKRLGCEPDEIDAIVDNYENLFTFIAAWPLIVYRALTDHEIRCPHCGQDIIHDENAWWGAAAEQNLQLNRAEYMFADRLLSAVVGGNLPYKLLSNDGHDVVDEIIVPNRHPFGNWLEMVKSEYGVKTWGELEKKLRTSADEVLHGIPEPRLRKWASGQDLVPFDVAQRIAKDTKAYDLLNRGFITARALAFVVDFLYAADLREDPSRQEVISTVYKRVAVLKDHVGLSLNRLRMLFEKKLKELKGAE